MNDHGERIIMPFLIVIAFVILSIRIATLLLRAALPQIIVVSGLLVPFLITIIFIIVLVERIAEPGSYREEDEFGRD